MKGKIDIEDMLQGLKSRKKKYLSKAITLVESRHPTDRQKAWELLKSLPQSANKSFRIAITGSPGVGKSTFIEAIGQRIAEQGKLAILSIDPSSEKGGSILGDKTRMENLANNENVYIRPSASGTNLGGVQANTAMSILLCESAGYQNIIIETVGVGQSELEVKNLSDCVILLLQPHTGDELQGIKKGIMEIADLIVINKADGELKDRALQLKNTMEELIHFSHDHKTKKIITCSSVENEGINNVLETLEAWKADISKSPKERTEQNRAYWKSQLQMALYDRFFNENSEINELLEQMANFEVDIPAAIEKVLKHEN